MKARPIALALLVAFAPVTFTLPRVALAQAKDDDPIVKAARARFQEGVNEFDKGNFEAARASFLEAYALKQHPAVLLNLAQSCLKSGHYLEAAKYFDKYLHDPQGDKKADASRGLADARSKLGRLDVTAPAGSDVSVDSKPVGRTPLASAIDVDAGNHTVHVRLPDGTSSEQRVVVTGGQLQPVRFGATATVVTPPTNPTPQNPENPTPPVTPPQTHPPETQPGVPPTTAPEGERVHPTAGLALGIAGGALAVGGFIVAGVFAGIKSTANSNYKSVEQQIIQNQKADGISPQTCDLSKLSSAQKTKYASACQTLQDNQNAVNQDATVANTFIVIGIVGVLAAAGGFVWWAIGHKKEAATATRLVPWIAPGTGGVTLSGTF
jgi:tetratricopeptide (TPR) repeat protein